MGGAQWGVGVKWVLWGTQELWGVWAGLGSAVGCGDGGCEGEDCGGGGYGLGRRLWGWG